MLSNIYLGLFFFSAKLILVSLCVYPLVTLKGKKIHASSDFFDTDTIVGLSPRRPLITCAAADIGTLSVCSGRDIIIQPRSARPDRLPTGQAGFVFSFLSLSLSFSSHAVMYQARLCLLLPRVDVGPSPCLVPSVEPLL